MNDSHIHFRAIVVTRAGGVIAYPTEGVYGLGCLPTASAAIERIIAMKGRGAEKGLILIAADSDQLAPYVDLSVSGGMSALKQADDQQSSDRACTWIVPASTRCPALVSGGRDTVAVRITRFAPAAALCHRAGSALISTSANRSGRPAITEPMRLQREFAGEVDAVVPQRPGSQRGVSRIIDLASGTVLRD